MNIPTLIAAVIVFLVIGFAFFYRVRSRKKEKSACSCSGCSVCGSCHPGK